MDVWRAVRIDNWMMGNCPVICIRTRRELPRPVRQLGSYYYLKTIYSYNWTAWKALQHVKQYTKWLKALFSSALAAPCRLLIIRCNKAQWMAVLLFRFPPTGKADLNKCTSETQPCCTLSNLPTNMLSNEMAQLLNNLAHEVLHMYQNA